MSPLLATFMPHVFISANKVRVKSYTGSFSSWKGYGNFFYTNFLKEAADIPESTRQEIRSLIRPLKNQREKARAIYQYMQRKMRYVSVQEGLGGFKTENAMQVDRLGYGDCKGLCNYTRALLEVAGIEAYYCEVKAGETNVLSSIPENFAGAGLFSNHIILCLPFHSDTTWLECTSKDCPFGYIGSFTDNRQAILISPEGAKIVHTCSYTEKENLQIRSSLITLDTNGNARGSLTTKLYGINYTDREALANISFQKQSELLKQIYPVSRLEINSYTLEHIKSAEFHSAEKMKFSIPQFIDLQGSEHYLGVSPFFGRVVPAFSRHKRSRPIVLPRGEQEIDTLTYVLPPEFDMKIVPDPEELHTQFGDFSVHLFFEKGRVTCVRKFTIHAGQWDAALFDDFVRFYQHANALEAYSIPVKKVGKAE